MMMIIITTLIIRIMIRIITIIVIIISVYIIIVIIIIIIIIIPSIALAAGPRGLDKTPMSLSGKMRNKLKVAKKHSPRPRRATRTRR